MASTTGTADHSLEFSMLEFPKDISRWNLVAAFYEFRRKMFMERLGWKLQEFERMEWEQYDGFRTVYAVAHIGDVIVGGGRLRRTDQTNGIYSYMIRDAVLDLLPGLPNGLLYGDAPVNEAEWELTRFATEGDPRIAAGLLYVINKYLFEKKAEGCFCLGTPAFLRMARRCAWEVDQMGPICGNLDGRFVVFRCSVVEPDTLIPGDVHRTSKGP